MGTKQAKKAVPNAICATLDRSRQIPRIKNKNKFYKIILAFLKK